MVDENWLCLKCGKVLCSRYRNEHCLLHQLESSEKDDGECHSVCLSFADLSFWCFKCDSYVTSERLAEVRSHFERLKFSGGENVDNVDTVQVVLTPAQAAALGENTEITPGGSGSG